MWKCKWSDFYQYKKKQKKRMSSLNIKGNVNGMIFLFTKKRGQSSVILFLQEELSNFEKKRFALLKVEENFFFRFHIGTEFVFNFFQENLIFCTKYLLVDIVAKYW